jgi:hypothetical protein
MPLTGSAAVLSADIVTRWRANPLIGFSSPLTPEQLAIVQAMADGVAEAVVAHIVANAVVAVTGVTVGTGAAAGTVT